MGRKASRVRMTNFNRVKDVLSGSDGDLSVTAKRILNREADPFAPEQSDSVPERSRRNGCAARGGVAGGGEPRPVPQRAADTMMDVQRAADTMMDVERTGGATPAAFDDVEAERLMYASVLM